MPEPNQLLIHGIFSTPQAGRLPGLEGEVGAAREHIFRALADTLGICRYEWVSGGARVLANKMLRKARGTAPAVEAVEIISLNDVELQASLASSAGRAAWQKAAACGSGPFDVERCFILMGEPRVQLKGSGPGQRLLWFGNGLPQLSRAEFINHYTTRHGPLVAGYGELTGLRCYRQVPAEREVLCNTLRELGMGPAPAPGVFAEMVMRAPPLRLASLLKMRAAMKEIKEDEQRHIDFGSSMLLLPDK